MSPAAATSSAVRCIGLSRFPRPHHHQRIVPGPRRLDHASHRLQGGPISRPLTEPIQQQFRTGTREGVVPQPGPGQRGLRVLEPIGIAEDIGARQLGGQRRGGSLELAKALHLLLEALDHLGWLRRHLLFEECLEPPSPKPLATMPEDRLAHLRPPAIDLVADTRDHFGQERPELIVEEFQGFWSCDRRG